MLCTFRVLFHPYPYPCLHERACLGALEDKVTEKAFGAHMKDGFHMKGQSAGKRGHEILMKASLEPALLTDGHEVCLDIKNECGNGTEL